MKRTFLILASAFALPMWALAENNTAPAADNTERNRRDSDGSTVTPEDQSGRPEDRQLTQSIRQAIMKDSSLSMTAKNVKIITANGTVTLRGPVNSTEEMKKVNDLAKAAAGSTPVHNQLEVKASN